MEVVESTSGPHDFPSNVIEELYRVQKIPGVKNIRVVCPTVPGKDRGEVVKHIGNKENIKRAHSYSGDDFAELVNSIIAFMQNPDDKYRVLYDTE